MTTSNHKDLNKDVFRTQNVKGRYLISHSKPANNNQNNPNQIEKNISVMYANAVFNEFCEKKLLFLKLNIF